MKKLLSYILSIINLTIFGLILVIFHPIQVISHRLFGYEAQRLSVAYMNLFLTRNLHSLGTRLSFEIEKDLPADRPLIFVANHQSLHDIPMLIWKLRRHHPKFVSKKELGKGIPSVSYNLRNSGAALIDRKDRVQALQEIERLAKLIESKKYSVIIFPEGTRSKTGVPRKFAAKGLQKIIEHAPSALLVPITINNSWKLYRYGKFPMSAGEHLSWYVHPPVDPKGDNIHQILEQVEQTVKSRII